MATPNPIKIPIIGMKNIGITETPIRIFDKRDFSK
jgi:hypothetical protein